MTWKGPLERVGQEQPTRQFIPNQGGSVPCLPFVDYPIRQSPIYTAASILQVHARE